MFQVFVLLASFILYWSMAYTFSLDFDMGAGFQPQLLGFFPKQMVEPRAAFAVVATVVLALLPDLTSRRALTLAATIQ